MIEGLPEDYLGEIVGSPTGDSGANDAMQIDMEFKQMIADLSASSSAAAAGAWSGVGQLGYTAFYSPSVRWLTGLPNDGLQPGVSGFGDWFWGIAAGDDQTDSVLGEFGLVKYDFDTDVRTELYHEVFKTPDVSGVVIENGNATDSQFFAFGAEDEVYTAFADKKPEDGEAGGGAAAPNPDEPQLPKSNLGGAAGSGSPDVIDTDEDLTKYRPKENGSKTLGGKTCCPCFGREEVGDFCGSTNWSNAPVKCDVIKKFGFPYSNDIFAADGFKQWANENKCNYIFPIYRHHGNPQMAASYFDNAYNYCIGVGVKTGCGDDLYFHSSSQACDVFADIKDVKARANQLLKKLKDKGIKARIEIQANAVHGIMSWSGNGPDKSSFQYPSTTKSIPQYKVIVDTRDPKKCKMCVRVHECEGLIGKFCPGGSAYCKDSNDKYRTLRCGGGGWQYSG